MTMNLHLRVVIVVLVLFVAGCATSPDPANPSSGNWFVPQSPKKWKEWEEAEMRGKVILDTLAHLSPEEAKKLDIAAFRGETVAFDGGAAPSGASNDLITGEGFYIRVLNASGKDLRPQSVAWEVEVRGHILQVLPEH